MPTQVDLPEFMRLLKTGKRMEVSDGKKLLAAQHVLMPAMRTEIQGNSR